MSDRVTLRDIAARAGVSVAAVSMALRGRGTVSPARAEQIRKLAGSMGYRPNPLLSSLASRKFRSDKSVHGTPLAILNFPVFPSGPVPEKSRQDVYLRDLVKEARCLGYEPTIFDYPFAGGIRKLEHVLYHRMVQGILVHGSVDQGGMMEDFDWSPYPVVQCARFHIAPEFHTVRPNIFQAVKLAFQKINALGYRRIGFAVARHDTLLEDDQARHGAAVAVAAAGLPASRRLPVYIESINDAAAFRAWVKKTRPDVVLGFSSRFYWSLVDMGFSIPSDIGFASLHLGPKPRESHSGLIQNTEVIARQSVILLDQLIRERQRGVPDLPMHLLIPSTWVDGRTLRSR